MTALAATAGLAAWLHIATIRQNWLITLDHTAFGPVEIVASSERSPIGRLTLRSTSGALPSLQALPAVKESDFIDISTGAWAFTGWKRDNTYAGESTASRAGDPFMLDIDKESLQGTIERGWFKGELSGQPYPAATAALRNYPGVVTALETRMREHLFDPSLVDNPAVRAYLDRLGAVAKDAVDDVDLLLASRWAWDDAPPFSHFELRRSNVDVATLTEQFEAMELGPDIVKLDFRGKVAVLRVERLLGKDTPARIEAAMRHVIERDAEALIIDLRGNPGGAFALVPLIAPVLDQPLLAGVFVTHTGRHAYPSGPDAATIATLPAWQGSTLAEWWQTLATEPLLKVEIAPSAHHFGGKVAVLIDGKTESAAELAAQALRDSGRATLVGEPSGGKMLSSAYFDLGEGFQAVLPIADYFAAGTKRIEGVGVQPDIQVPADQALDNALRLLASAR